MPNNLQETFKPEISQVLERILMEHIESKNSLESKLQINSICSIRIFSRNGDIFDKGQLTKEHVKRIGN